MATITDEALVDMVAELAALTPQDLHDDTPLITSGLLDSFAMLELIVRIEQQGSVKIKPKDIHLRHLDSLSQLRAFLGKLGVYAVT